MGSLVDLRQAKEKKLCELVLSGANVSECIEEYGLDPNIFEIPLLNFLEISKTPLQFLPDQLGQLTNLTRVIFSFNKLTKLPSSIGQLKKLKFLDFSFNQIEQLPDEVSNLTELQTLNVGNNKLSALPNLTGLHKLVSLNISQNEFTEFPSEQLCSSSLIHFTDLIANNNKIDAIAREIGKLEALKILNLDNNALTEIPGELSDCTKLKELHLKGNKVKDRRLLKLIDQCHVKQIMDYVRSHCPRESVEDNNKQAKTKKQVKHNKKAPANDEITQLLDQIKVLHVQDETVKVTALPSVQDVRSHIVCCIVCNVDFKKGQTFKQFIAMQTRLHETVCENRKASTIATHDLAKVNGNLVYDAREPNKIKIMPLNQKKEMTAVELYMKLNNEADALRKEKKKNTYSGIHKYLYLLKDKTLYPCLVDEGKNVISFPPITNSEISKVSEDTQNIFVEVTGNTMSACKKTMDKLLEEILKLGIGNPDQQDADSPRCFLDVQQVKVVDEEGHLRVVYPSRTDILSPDINVIRC